MIAWEAEGFQIVGEAGNGKDALELVKTLKPHIVITDIVMPVMDGLELEKILRTKFPDIQIIVLSSYSDFDYVRNSFQSGAVDYILKPTLNPENLLSTMKKVALRITGVTIHSQRDLSITACIKQMLSGFSDENAKDQLQNAFSEDRFVLVGMDIDRIFGQEKSSIEKQKKMLSFTTDEIIPNYNYVQLIVNQMVLLLLFNFNQSKEDELFKSLRYISDKIAKREPRTFFVASKVFTDIEMLKKVYNGAFLRNLDSYFYYKGKHFLTEKEFKKIKTANKFNIADYKKLIETLQITKALDYLENYVITVLSQWSMDEMELKLLVQNSWYQIISALEEQGLNADNLSYLKRDCLVKIYGCSYAEDFKDVFLIIQKDLLAIVEKYEVETRGSTIKNILNYIDNHYNEQLTLASLAKKFHFNYTYLSSYFNLHHKEGFSEYLNNERIKHASNFLKKGTLSISEICGIVGYTDHSYFTRVFKRITGMTPREFRKRCYKSRS